MYYYVSQIILYINKYIIQVLVRGDGKKNKTHKFTWDPQEGYT